jgi:hypothetical protein
MESITARIRVARNDSPSSPFFFATDLAEFTRIGLKHDTHWNHTDIGTGSQLVIRGQEYEVVRIGTSFHDTCQNDVGEHGIHAFGHGDRYPYNFEITYYVTPLGS